jgi:single-stranded DNA-binding protein
MALIKLHDDIYLAAGNATKDAELKHVGEKNTALGKFSIAAGKRKDTTTIFLDIAAWRNLADYAAGVCKGDSVCAIGRMESREYNGKTYHTLNADWLNVVGKVERTGGSYSESELPPAVTTFAELSDSESDLPF